MQNPLNQINSFAQGTGIMLMAAAALAGVVELPSHDNRIVLNAPMTLSPASANNDNPLRREKDEAAPHYISYAVMQRTPGRSSKK